jgi:asparagine N-glycosylation enzyme membrane subunit Stt3
MLKKLSFSPYTLLLLLLIPLTVMQFSTEVYWSFLDFVIMGVLLLALGFSIRFIHNKKDVIKYPLLMIFAVVVLFFVIWAELAVGIFDSPIGGS